ncbi:putative ATPase [Hymenobacter sp. UYAg731]
MPTRAQAPAVPRLTYLRIKNYRALRDVEFRDLTPLTVLIGPNGSGKSTVLDALDFLAEAVRGNLVGAWEKRNRFQGMRTRGSEGSIEFELKISYPTDNTFLRYTIEITEKDDKPFVLEESLCVPSENGRYHPLYFVEGSPDDPEGYMRSITLFKNKHWDSPDNYDDAFEGPTSRVEDRFFALESNTFLPYLKGTKSTIREEVLWVFSLLDSYRYIHLTDDHLKGYSDAGPREKLSPNGDNLPNVLYYLHTRHPETLAKITAQMRKWVPSLADVVPEITSDERILLRFRDAEFEKPLPAQYMSDGTMRLAALLTLLYEPDAAGLLGIEEPENELHPRLLPRLAEELGKATEKRQLLVATHSPFLLDGLEPEQVWILHRGADGYTQATRTADIPHVKQMVEDGSPLGYLWTSNFFSVGDPLAPQNPASNAR